MQGKSKRNYNAVEKLSVREKFNWFLVGLAVISAIFSILVYGKENSREIEQQREYELIKVSQNTSHYFSNFLENKLEWMRIFASAISMSEYAEKEEWWELLEREHSEDYQLGIADVSGNIYFGRHERKEVSNREYFKQAMMGESYISRIEKKKLHKNDSIILSVPIKNVDGTIEGIVAMEYSTMKLGEYINDINEDWDEYGVNIIINSKGEIIASYPGMEKYNTIYNMLQKKTMEKQGSLEKMKQDVVEREAGMFRYYNGDMRRMLYYQPLDINDWTMVSIAAMKSNLVILKSIEKINLLFSVIFTFIILTGTIATRNIFYCRTKKIKKMELDNLTKIYRREIGEEIVKSVFAGRECVRIYGCMFVDVDDFKYINDTYGHEKGDEVLAALGKILLASSRRDDIVYRYGGDEFCIWFCGEGGKKEIMTIGNRILARVNKNEDIHLSIGAALVEEMERDWQDVLKRADEAVYEAKLRGKNQIVLNENREAVF